MLQRKGIFKKEKALKKKGRHEDKGLTGKLGQGEKRTLREEPSSTKGGFIYFYVQES